MKKNRREHKRILYLIETGGMGGCEKVLLNLARHFRNTGNSVSVGLGDKGWLLDTLRDENFDVRLITGGKEIAGINPWTVRDVDRMVREFKPDVIHAFLFHMNVYGALVGAFRRCPSIVSLRSKHYDFEKTRRILAWKLINKLTTQVTAASDDLADVLSSRCGIDRSSILSIPNGVDTERYSAISDKKAAKRELGLPEDLKLVGTVGRMNPVKGHEDFARAAKIVRDSGLDLMYTVIGAKEEPVFGLLSEINKESGMDTRFVLPGVRDDAPKWLQAMDYFVLPSHSEGMSNALLEAMACGLPIIATDVGSNGQLLNGGECGLIIPPHDPEQLAEAIRRLTESEELSHRLASAAYARVVECYSQGSMLATYTDLYERVCCGV